MNEVRETWRFAIHSLLCVLLFCLLAIVSGHYFDKKLIEIQNREATQEANDDYRNSPKYRATMRALMQQLEDIENCTNCP